MNKKIIIYSSDTQPSKKTEKLLRSKLDNV